MATAGLLAELEAVFYQVKAHFIEYPDRGEHWQMPPAGYTGQEILRDDCDGFCLACRTLLRRRGIRNRLVYCEVDGGGHLVVEAAGWILDNRQSQVVANTQLSAQRYRWLRISGYQAGEPWRQIVSQ